MPALAIDFTNLPLLDQELADASGVLLAADTIPAEVEALVRALAGELRGLGLDAWRETVDPYLLVELQRVTLGALLALDAEDEAAGAAALEISLEAIRDILYDAQGAAAVDALSPRELTRRLRDATQASTQEVAELLRVRKRTLERWLSGESEPQRDDAMRLAMAARIVDQLRHAMTGRGAMLWFATPLTPNVPGGPDGPHDDRAPRDLLADPQAAPALLGLAAAARRSDAS